MNPTTQRCGILAVQAGRFNALAIISGVNAAARHGPRPKQNKMTAQGAVTRHKKTTPPDQGQLPTPPRGHDRPGLLQHSASSSPHCVHPINSRPALHRGGWEGGGEGYSFRRLVFVHSFMTGILGIRRGGIHAYHNQFGGGEF